MYIHEAIKDAMPRGKAIRRTCDSWVQLRTVLFPTTTSDGMIISGPGSKCHPRWNPDAEDLMADDWEVLPG